MGIEPTVFDFRPGAEQASPACRSTRIPKKETAIDPHGELAMLTFRQGENRALPAQLLSV